MIVKENGGVVDWRESVSRDTLSTEIAGVCSGWENLRDQGDGVFLACSWGEIFHHGVSVHKTSWRFVPRCNLIIKMAPSRNDWRTIKFKELYSSHLL